MKLEEYFKIDGTYELVDGFYNVKGDVLLNIDCEKLPVKFGIVTGSFYCNDNFLTSLEGCPEQVGGSFECYNNHLTSLEGAPTHISDSFWCDDNFLTSLKGCPTSVGGYFSCDEILHNTKEYRQYEIIKELKK